MDSGLTREIVERRKKHDKDVRWMACKIVFPKMIVHVFPSLQKTTKVTCF